MLKNIYFSNSHENCQLNNRELNVMIIQRVLRVGFLILLILFSARSLLAKTGSMRMMMSMMRLA